MKISVITVAYNSAATIVDTVESVLEQSHPDLEYLVIDGGSMDATLAKLEPFRDRIDGLLSEPDQGMYDAMNKGIAQATGEVVAILNSDDVYADSGVLARVAAAFEDSGRRSKSALGARILMSADSRSPTDGNTDGEVDVVYGDLHYVSPDLQRVVRDWQSGLVPAGGFRRGWHPPHPSFFVRRRVYERLGGFRLDLRIAADYEFMLRVLGKEGCSAAYLPEVMVKMRTGGASNQSVGNIWKANRECVAAWRMNGYSAFAGWSAVVRKPLRKLRQITR